MRQAPPFSLVRYTLLQILIAGLIALPVFTAIWYGLTTGGNLAWDHILTHRLGPYTLTTLMVLFLTGTLACILAIPLAWLVSLYDFPFRRVMEWGLILPLAIPGYVLAYAWADLAGVAGPIQAGLREVTGLSARDYWFPSVFSIPGLSGILALTLFPYVYITARAAFTTQSLATLEAGRCLGASGWHLFWRVGLPAARPAVLAGLSLVLMEAAADYGAADYLGVQTLGVGIVRAWTSFGEPATAARLALVLISLAFAFLIVSKLATGAAGSQQTSYRWTTPARTQLTTGTGFAVLAYFLLILSFSFGLPVTRLIWLSLATSATASSLMSALTSSLSLAATGTTLAFMCSLVMVLASHYSRRGAWPIRLAAASGYAAPGVVLGLGGLFLLKASGQALTGGLAIGLLVWIYASRFTSAGTEPLFAALSRAPASLDQATRSLGVTGALRFWRVDLPLLAPGALAGGLILFVEILKELPATLMLRPFGWDTLAVRAHAYASDERLASATLPALLITLSGLVPVILLSRQMTQMGDRIR
jgi:iron(III) transport system permease protein